MGLSLSLYADQRWLTFKQAGELGGNVRKGERSTLVAIWKQYTVKDEDAGDEVTRAIPLLRYYNVFNVAHCEGLDLEPVQTSHVEPIEAAQAIVAEMPNPPRITHDGGDRAYYVPSNDSIHMPVMATFDGAGEHHSTLFHELSHSTGHQTRLNRESLETPAPFGSEVYSREELVAEFGAGFLCAQAGIDNTLDNSAAYIAGWSCALRNDKRLVVTAGQPGPEGSRLHPWGWRIAGPRRSQTVHRGNDDESNNGDRQHSLQPGHRPWGLEGG